MQLGQGLPGIHVEQLLFHTMLMITNGYNRHKVTKYISFDKKSKQKITYDGIMLSEDSYSLALLLARMTVGRSSAPKRLRARGVFGGMCRRWKQSGGLYK